MLKEGIKTKVRYHKDVSERKDDIINIKHETTERVIIPTRVPKPPLVKALDVTHLSEKEREQLEKSWKEYSEYVTDQMRTLFTFEDFVDHTNTEQQPHDNIKWRSFNPSLLEVVFE